MPIAPARIACFVAAYKANPNAYRAALAAGYGQRSAIKKGPLLLRRPEVQAALAAQAESEFGVIEKQAGRVLAEAARVAFADPAGLFDAAGRLKPVPEMSGDCLAAVSHVEETRKGGVRLLRHGKLAALALLARYVQLLTPGALVFEPEEEASGEADSGEEEEDAPFLTVPRKARFAAEYTVDFNATRAAIRAGYRPQWAQNRGYKLLLEPEVQAAIAARAHRRFARSAISPERVLREIARIAFFDIRRLAPDGRPPRDIHALDADARAAFATIEITPPERGGAFRFRCLNKVVALKLLMAVLEASGEPLDSCPPHSNGEVSSSRGL